MTATSDDGFLGGRLKILQPKDGFRSGIDAVLLAASVPAEPGEAVLELGCGAGVAMLCLAARVPRVVLAGLEVQENYAALARGNAARNGIAAEVFAGDLRAIPEALRERSFDHVMANPPYYRAGHWTRSGAGDRARALGEEAALADWADAAVRRLRPGGRLCMIQKAPRLGDLLAVFDGRMGAVEIKPVAPRERRDAELVLLRARKGARAAPRLCAPLVLHGRPRHERDGADWTESAEDLLRHGTALNF